MRISDWSSDVCSSDLEDRTVAEDSELADDRISPLELCEHHVDPPHAADRSTGELLHVDRDIGVEGEVVRVVVDRTRDLDQLADQAAAGVEEPQGELVDAEATRLLATDHVAAVEIGRASCRDRVCQYV